MLKSNQSWRHSLGKYWGQKLHLSEGNFTKRHEDYQPQRFSARNKTFASIYASHERQKTPEYEARIVQIERGNFIPFVVSATGGLLGPFANGFVQRLAYCIAAKRREPYSKIVQLYNKPTTKRVSILPGESYDYRSTRQQDMVMPLDILVMWCFMSRVLTYLMATIYCTS